MVKYLVVCRKKKAIIYSVPCEFYLSYISVCSTSLFAIAYNYKSTYKYSGFENKKEIQLQMQFISDLL